MGVLICMYVLNYIYSWIGHGLKSGPTLAFLLWLTDFKIKNIVGFPIKKIRGRFFKFFKKSKNELVRPKMVFLVILAKIQPFSNNSDIIHSEFASYERITS